MTEINGSVLDSLLEKFIGERVLFRTYSEIYDKEIYSKKGLDNEDVESRIYGVVEYIEYVNHNTESKMNIKLKGRDIISVNVTTILLNHLQPVNLQHYKDAVEAGGFFILNKNGQLYSLFLLN